MDEDKKKEEDGKYFASLILKKSFDKRFDNASNIIQMLDVFLRYIKYSKYEKIFFFILFSFEYSFEKFRNEFVSAPEERLQVFLKYIRQYPTRNSIQRIYSISFEIIWKLKREPSTIIDAPFNQSRVMIHHMNNYFREGSLDSQYLDYIQTELLQKCDELRLILYR